MTDIAAVLKIAGRHTSNLQYCLQLVGQNSEVLAVRRRVFLAKNMVCTQSKLSMDDFEKSIVEYLLG